MLENSFVPLRIKNWIEYNLVVVGDVTSRHLRQMGADELGHAERPHAVVAEDLNKPRREKSFRIFVFPRRAGASV